MKSPSSWFARFMTSLSDRGRKHSVLGIVFSVSSHSCHQSVCLLLWGWSFGNPFKGDSGSRASPLVQAFHISLFFTRQRASAFSVIRDDKTVVCPWCELFPLTGSVCKSDVLLLSPEITFCHFKMLEKI